MSITNYNAFSAKMSMTNMTLDTPLKDLLKAIACGFPVYIGVEYEVDYDSDITAFSEYIKTATPSIVLTVGHITGIAWVDNDNEWSVSTSTGLTFTASTIEDFPAA